MRLLFSLFLTGLAIAAPSPRSTHVLHERRAALSPEWVQSRRLDSDLILPMKFGLTQQNMHRLEELLLEISHPESPKYSQHYTPEQVMETFAPSAESIDEVMNWLTDSGIARERIRLSGNKSWIHLNATVTEAEELLQTEYHVFSHSSGEETLGMFTRLLYYKHPSQLSFLRLPSLLSPRTCERTHRYHQAHCSLQPATPIIPPLGTSNRWSWQALHL